MASALRPTLLRQALAKTAVPAFRSQQQPLIARAAFQTSAKRAILPPLPQVINGGVNDPAPIPETHPSHGSYHWTAERLVSAAILPMTAMPFAVGSLNPVLDGTLIGLTLLHTYIGFQSVITDYIPTWRAKTSRKIFEWLNVAALVIVGWGYYEFETNDVGLTEGVKRIWKASATPKDATS